MQVIGIPRETCWCIDTMSMLMHSLTIIMSVLMHSLTTIISMLEWTGGGMWIIVCYVLMMYLPSTYALMAASMLKKPLVMYFLYLYVHINTVHTLVVPGVIRPAHIRQVIHQSDPNGSTSFYNEKQESEET